MFYLRAVACAMVLAAILCPTIARADTVPTDGHFVNFETPHISPIAISPNGGILAACNTPDNRVELFDLATGTPEPILSIPVGMDPVSVRFFSDAELWVVNHVSDSISIVDLTSGNVAGTIQTLDEPTDVVFAGSPLRAFVSCSQVNKIMVFDPLNWASPLQTLSIQAEEPRAMAVSADGGTVYCAVYESGNRSTLLGGGADGSGVITFPPNVVDDPGTPHGVQNPPFNGTGVFIPAKTNPDTAPPVGIIVKENDSGEWLDDTGANWRNWVNGVLATSSGRYFGWELLDHDLVVINANTLAVSYVDHMMNICMALAVNPATGAVHVVGTDGINEVRFEPNVNSIFNRVLMATTDAGVLQTNAVLDLNSGHLDYQTRTIAQNERDKSIGDPRGIVWDGSGATAYVTGMGSNNVIVVDAAGLRDGLTPTIEVGEGPTGIVYDSVNAQLYVLNKFGSSISVVDLNTETQSAEVAFFDPSPPAIKLGRKHLYDTHKNSGLGQAACASCHIDSRMDRLAWDLGDPSGETVPHTDALLALNKNAGIGVLNNLGNNFTDIHPMKGPMTTQTLQDIIGHEPLHWRGDRFGIEQFNGAFIGLQGDDTNLDGAEMQEFEDFLHTIHFAPNPYRNLDNTLKTSLPLEGHYNPGKFGGTGQPLGTGNAVAGLSLYRSLNRRLDRNILACVSCHTLPSGNGPNMIWNAGQGQFEAIPDGPMGQKHLMMVAVDGSTQRMIKVAHLRNMYEKVGTEFSPSNKSLSGFGFAHDGSVDSLARFVSEDAFEVQSTQEIADLVALMISWTGSDFGVSNNGTTQLEPPGNLSQDVHAAVGRQVTITDPGDNTTALFNLLGIVDASERVELIAKGVVEGEVRGWLYTGSNNFQADEAELIQTLSEILNGTGPGEEVTFTVVPAGSGVRMGIDRDLDGAYDYHELQCESDPADPTDLPPLGCPAAEPIAIGSHPTSVSVDRGDNASFSVGNISGAVPPYFYQWTYPGNPNNVSGADTATLNITGADTGGNLNGGTYYCVVTDSSPGVPLSAQSNNATLTVVYPKGASCFPDGTCFLLTEAACNAAGGVYGGDDTSCIEVACTAGGEGEGEGASVYIDHAADQNGNHVIGLSELLRVIQIFNLGVFHCNAGTEDGFSPGAGDQSCTPHSSDFNPQDWIISLTELLRLIQIFNLGGYHHCPTSGTDDGFCPIPVL